MYGLEIIALSQDLLNKARVADIYNEPDKVIIEFKKLRDLLNKQPELAAGESVETDKCKGCGFKIAKGMEYCGECVCENDFDP